MCYLVFRPDAEVLKDSGYARVAHIPFLIHESGSYPELANRYLRARALCEWLLRMGTSSEAREPTGDFLTAVSCDCLVGRLKSFLMWADLCGLAHENIQYPDLLEWREGLLKGSMSVSGKALQPDTADLYLNEACYFLTWMSLVPRNAEGDALRGPFEVFPGEVPVQPRQKRDAWKWPKTIAGRAGSFGARRSRIFQLPSEQEIARWMRALRARCSIKALMAEVILDSGIRISEVNFMQTTDLPPRNRWKPVGGRVHFKISMGVKGRKIAADSKVSVRGREISLSLEVAEKVDQYRSFTRETQLRRWIRSGKTKAEQHRRASSKPSRLWLSKFSNKPFANEQFRNAWTTTAYCPENWHPHAGRHWFAVDMLVKVALDALRLHDTNLPNLTWLDGVMRNQIDILIRPTLGHQSVATTEGYLQAAKFRLAEIFGSSSLRWQDFIDRDDGPGDGQG